MSLGTCCRAATVALLTVVGQHQLTAQHQVAHDATIDALLDLVRQHAVVRTAADAAVASATAAVPAAVPPPFVTFGVSAEGVPSGMRFDRADQVVVGVEGTLWRGAAAASLRRAAEARPAVYQAWRTLVVGATEAQVEADLARFAGATLRHARLRAEALLLSDAERALGGRIATGDARYLDVLRLRTARLQVDAELASEAAAITTARISVLMAIHAGPARDSAARLLASLPADSALTALSDSARAEAGAAVEQFVTALSAANRATAVARRRASDPVLDASLGMERFGNVGEGWRLGPALGLTLRVPFPGQGTGDRIAHAAEAERTAIDGELAVRAHRAESGREMARAHLAAAHERAALLSTALLDGAPGERAAAVAAFTAGRLSLLELLDLERALSHVAMERIDALVDAATAAATVRSAWYEPYLTVDLLMGGAP